MATITAIIKVFQYLLIFLNIYFKNCLLVLYIYIFRVQYVGLYIRSLHYILHIMSAQINYSTLKYNMLMFTRSQFAMPLCPILDLPLNLFLPLPYVCPHSTNFLVYPFHFRFLFSILSTIVSPLFIAFRISALGICSILKICALRRK